MNELMLTLLPLTPEGGVFMPGIWEWVVILVIVLVIFGPGKLPQIGEALGKGIKSFKKATARDDEIDVTPKQIDEPSQPVDNAHTESSKERQTTSAKD